MLGIWPKHGDSGAAMWYIFWVRWGVARVANGNRL